MSAPDNKQGFLSNLSPWASRASTPKPPATPKPEGGTERAKKMDQERDRELAATVLASQQGGDHIIDRRQRLSLKRYPPDCPPLAVRWFHAIDVSRPRKNPLRNCVSRLCADMPSLTKTDAQEKAALETRNGARHGPAQAQEMAAL